jgi:hypothetical protein
VASRRATADGGFLPSEDRSKDNLSLLAWAYCQSYWCDDQYDYANRNELGEFLEARRAALSLMSIGLPETSAIHRTPQPAFLTQNGGSPCDT